MRVLYYVDYIEFEYRHESTTQPNINFQGAAYTEWQQVRIGNPNAYSLSFVVSVETLTVFHSFEIAKLRRS